MQQADLLTQLEQIRDALVDLADEFGLWAVVHAIDEVLERYDALYQRSRTPDGEGSGRHYEDGTPAGPGPTGSVTATQLIHPFRPW